MSEEAMPDHVKQELPEPDMEPDYSDRFKKYGWLEMPVRNKNILKALHEVMKEVPYIQKDKFNPQGKYNYASERAIKEALHPAFVKHGVVFKLDVSGDPNIVKAEHMERSTGGIYGTSYVSLRFNYTFFHVETGESISGQFIGTGNSREDKGVYAAITGAIKYILSSTFLFATGDDPEGDAGDHPAESGQRPMEHGAGAVPSKAITVDDIKRTFPGSTEVVGRSPSSNRPPMETCPNCGVQAVIKGQPQYGGGYVCWKKGGGCNSKWTDEGWEAVKHSDPPPFTVPDHVAEERRARAALFAAAREHGWLAERKIGGDTHTAVLLPVDDLYEYCTQNGIKTYDINPAYVLYDGLTVANMDNMTEIINRHPKA